MLLTASYTNIGGRPRNEDSVMKIAQGSERICVVVADGLGGHGGGEQASSAAAGLICRSWNGTVDAEYLDELIQQANAKVLSLQTPECAMKTTVVVLTIENDRAVWAHDGDTRLYLFRDGKLFFQTMDHSAAQIGVMLGQITPEQIRFHADRSKVLRALGQDDHLTVETKEMQIKCGDAFLICTDGFWEYVLENEMEEDLANSESPEQWIDLMRKRLSAKVPADNDNNTAAAVWVK